MKTILIILASLLVFGMCDDPNKVIIQQCLNGYWEQSGLKDPTTIVPCIDDKSAAQIVQFANTTLNTAANGSLQQLLALPDQIKAFTANLNPAVGQCLDGNAELAQISAVYGFDNIDKAKVISYITLHFLGIHKSLQNLNTLFDTNHFVDFGKQGAILTKQVLGKGEVLEDDPNKVIIQQILNGYWEQSGLKDPTTIVICIDDKSAAQIVQFANTTLNTAANGSLQQLLALPDQIKSFAANLNPAVGQCLDGNAEIAQISAVYDFDHVDKAKVITYVTLHFLGIHKSLQNINTLFDTNHFVDVGKQAAVLTKQVLGKGENLNDDPNKVIIQQALNGYFEESGLPDPVTIVPCIDDKSAAQIVQFVGTTLNTAANGSLQQLLALPDQIKAFTSNLNPAVGQCLNGNAEVQALSNVYDFDHVDKTKVISYITLHYLSVHKSLQGINNNWQSTHFYDAGKQGAQLTKTVLGKGEEYVNEQILE